MDTKDFLNNDLSYAIVMRGDMSIIDEVKRYLATKDMRIIYQRMSFEPLYITDTDPSNSEGNDDK